MMQYILQSKSFYRNLIRFVLPVALQNLITYLLGLIDTVMLGFVGQTELAAAALANSPLFLITLICFGFQSAMSLMTAQYWGQRDEIAINRIIGMAFISVLSLTLFFCVILLVMPEKVIALLTDSPELINPASRYLKIMAVACLLNSFTLVYMTSQRCMENTIPALYIMGGAVVLNTFLNWVFIYGNLGAPRMGITGAALATVTARTAELAATVVYAACNRFFRLSVRYMFRMDRRLIKDFIFYGAPVVINETLWGLGIACYPAILGRMGAFAVAAYTIAYTIERVFNIIMLGISNAAVVLIGKELGTGRMKSAYEKAVSLVLIGAGFGIVSAFCMRLAAPYIMTFLNVPEETIRLSVTIVTIFMFRIPASSISCILINGILRAGGDTRAATWIDLAPLWLFALPSAVLAGIFFKLDVVFVCMAIASEDIIKSAISIMRTRRKNWLQNITRKPAYMEMGVVEGISND